MKSNERQLIYSNKTTTIYCSFTKKEHLNAPNLRGWTCPKKRNRNAWFFHCHTLSMDLVKLTLARLNMESLLASYGWSFEGISRTAGTGEVWASITWRISSAQFWLIRMMSMSSRFKKRLKQSSSSLTAVSKSLKAFKLSCRWFFSIPLGSTHFYRPPWNWDDDFCLSRPLHQARTQHRCPIKSNGFTIFHRNYMNLSTKYLITDDRNQFSSDSRMQSHFSPILIQPLWYKTNTAMKMCM